MCSLSVVCDYRGVVGTWVWGVVGSSVYIEG
jgi:hypothetical protein